MKKLKIFLLGFAIFIPYFIYNPTQNQPRILYGLPESSLSTEQIRGGGEILYGIGILYVLFGIREVCSGFFMPIIDYIVNKYSISPNVAGATLMALGGSAPEIFICFMSTFAASSTIGFSTIIGSGAFNAILLVGICAMSAKSVFELQWWQVARDFMFNMVLLGLLVLFWSNLFIDWYEGLVLILVYILYVYFMKFNGTIEKFFKKHLNLPYEGDEVDFKPLPDKPFKLRRYSISELEAYIPQALNFKRGILAKMIKNAQLQIVKNSSEESEELRARFKYCVYLIMRAIEEKKKCQKRNKEERGLIYPYKHEVFDKEDIIAPMARIRKLQTIEEKKEILSEVSPSRSLLNRILRCLMLPLRLCLKLTIPNIERHPKLWIFSMIISLTWIGGLSFLLVWWTSDIGMALGIPESVLGITILAMGVSIPDLLNSLKVTIEGHGDMALSGCIGSNILNLGVGIGVPCFFEAVINHPIDIPADLYMAEYVMMSVFGTSYIFLAGFKFQLSRHFGVVMFFFYASFLTIFLVFEFLNIH
ncbi:unnamed protein product [Blepharisma stoltei]|uniref:Sodium/calcium exchanger membrane region domain-containing protein n=1 Tax=Blepharisma stoltei TaxID=1481888 RepID=A0AAU9JGL4_9CILI|nr:unnamed protein product [Blepharisma stoltei]